MELRFQDDDDSSQITENFDSKIKLDLSHGSDVFLKPAEKLNNINVSKNSFSFSVPFFALCELFDRISKISKPAQKKSLLEKFFSKYQDDDYFPLMRLLLPQLDKDRQTYGMKETVLGKIYVELLGIAITSEDARRLIHYKKPTGKPDEKISGDFGNAVYASLRTRCIDRGDLSIADINQFLDRLNISQERKDKMIILKEIIRRTSASEQKWFVRIILKELKIGISEKTILNYFHPDALELFNVSSNLRTVCKELKNPSIRLTSISSDGVSLFQPIKPMLASRHSPEDVVKIMEGNPFIIEQKFDGERIQVHKNGKEIRLFSRNSNNVTELYGDKLIPMLLHQVLVSRCILDGELLVWDSISERFEEFGKLKTFAISGREESEENSTIKSGSGINIGKQLCYVIFDLLFVNDRSVMDLSLQQRMLLLQRCIKPKPKHIEIVHQKEAHSAQDVIEALDQAIQNCEEGIVIKNLNSTYVPSERKNKWIKLKPEYIEGLGDDLDLLIIGGYYGTGERRGGNISHFMLGVAARTDEEEAMQAHPKTFYSFCKVGTGYSLKELGELQKLLEKHWHVFKTQQPPPFIQLAEPFKEKPDVWIEPALILQIKAAQMVPSEKYKAGYTLRFPRVVKIRADKNWFDCTDLKNLRDLALQFGGRYARRKMAEIKDETKTRKRAISYHSRKARTVLPHFAAADTRGIVVENSIFHGLEFCVMNGNDDISKSELEKLIHRFGGTNVQHPTHFTKYLVAGKRVLRIQNVIQRSEYDVVNPKWILDCINQKSLLNLEPKYVIYTTESTRKMFLLEIDRFGDSFTRDATESSLHDAFNEISKLIKDEQTDFDDNRNDKENKSIVANTNILEIEQNYFGKTAWGIFRNYVVYVDRFLIVGEPSTRIPLCSLDLSAHLLNYFGAQISDKISEDVTHIIVDARDQTRLREIQLQSKQWYIRTGLAKHVVSKEWVEESAQYKEDLDEGEFYIVQKKHL